MERHLEVQCSDGASDGAEIVHGALMERHFWHSPSVQTWLRPVPWMLDSQTDRADELAAPAVSMIAREETALEQAVRMLDSETDLAEEPAAPTVTMITREEAALEQVVTATCRGDLCRVRGGVS
eukprot:TRINITY_DN4872_c0_g1_i4.p1 TRINITY_DN4872_c0_g1~~TRINITY_DN4872_c0_g1_i4.p1  ORF type:complete len:124 (-),score=26.36 TRINITY_DN4872_c0_g1_i4:55-426(-)